MHAKALTDISCIVWDIDPVLLSIGQRDLYWYGLIFGISLLTGYILLYWQFNRAGYLTSMDGTLRFICLVFYIVAGAIAGAYIGDRVFYQWNSFISDPLNTLSLKSDFRGLSSHGATIGILAAAFIFHLRHKIRYLEILDRVAFSVATSSAMVRLGNLMNSEIVGRKTDAAWAFCFPLFDGRLIPRHPSQIYEFFIGMAVLILLFIVDRKAGSEKRPLGLLSGTFFAAYFPMRFLVEFVKEYQVISHGSAFTMGQLLSIPCIAFGAYLVNWSLKNHLPAGLKEKEQ